jgi:hypothetical protein
MYVVKCIVHVFVIVIFTHPSKVYSIPAAFFTCYECNMHSTPNTAVKSSHYFDYFYVNYSFGTDSNGKVWD